MAPDSALHSTRGLALAAVVIAAAFLYSVLVMAAPMAWLGALVPLAFLYLAWRFVRAHERIADAAEAGVSSVPQDE